MVIRRAATSRRGSAGTRSTNKTARGRDMATTLAASGFPGSVIEPFLSTVKSFFRSGVTNAGEAFRKYLNGGDNGTVRLFVAEAAGSVQQASTVLVLRRLAAAADAKPLPAYGYAGTFEVAYAGGDETLEKLKNLLPELAGETEGKVGEATVKLIAYPFESEPEEVNLGLTGGAPEDLDFPAELKVKFFLRLQPYRQEGPEQVWISGKEAPIELTDQVSLGKAKFALRAYGTPAPAVSAAAWNYYTGAGVPADVRRNAEVLRWLTDEAQATVFALQPADGIAGYREDGKLVDCPMGSPASERLIQLIAGALASQLAPSGQPAPGAAPVIVINFSRYDPAAAENLSFDYLASLLKGGPTEAEFPFLPESLGGNAEGQGVAEVGRTFQRRRAYLKKVKAGEGGKLIDKPTLAQAQQAANAIRNQPAKLLFLQLGPVPGPLYEFTFAKSGLPPVFTGLDSANLALALGNFYYNVPSPEVGGVQYPETVLTKSDNGTVPFTLQTVADQIGLGLGNWPARDADNPAEVQGEFVRSW